MFICSYPCKEYSDYEDDAGDDDQVHLKTEFALPTTRQVQRWIRLVDLHASYLAHRNHLIDHR